MEYAIKILKDERDILEKCLKEWKSFSHKEAYKVKDNHLKDIKKALHLINTITNPLTKLK